MCARITTFWPRSSMSRKSRNCRSDSAQPNPSRSAPGETLAQPIWSMVAPAASPLTPGLPVPSAPTAPRWIAPPKACETDPLPSTILPFTSLPA